MYFTRLFFDGGETTMALPPGTPDGAPPPPGHCAVNVAIPDGASGQQWISIRTHRLSAMAHMHIYNVLKRNEQFKHFACATMCLKSNDHLGPKTRRASRSRARLLAGRRARRASRFALVALDADGQQLPPQPPALSHTAALKSKTCNKTMQRNIVRL